MMGKPARRDSPLFVTLDLDRVYPQRHPLRRIDDVLDLSFVRGALLYPPPNLTRASLTAHILHILRQGITARGPQ